MTVRVGLVGYGVGGQYFHAPYLLASEEISLAGVVARSPERAAAVETDIPGVPVHDSLASLMASGIDAVVISTPPHTRDALVREAVAGGVHVVADKPFAPDAASGQQLADLAAEAGVLLNVFHNRRFDTDIVTARAMIADGRLGAVTRLDLRCDQDDPSSLEHGPAGGLLRDLGSHVVDQALYLLGPAALVSAHIDIRDLDAGSTDTGFVISVTHTSGAHSHISSSKINHLSSRELRLHGEFGAYTSDFRDVQIDAIREGRRPTDDRARWGFETSDRWGTLALDSGTSRVPSLQGDYTRFYDEFADAVQKGGQGPVPAAEGAAVLAVLDAARTSAREGRLVRVR